MITLAAIWFGAVLIWDILTDYKTWLSGGVVDHWGGGNFTGIIVNPLHNFFDLGSPHLPCIYGIIAAFCGLVVRF